MYSVSVTIFTPPFRRLSHIRLSDDCLIRCNNNYPAVRTAVTVSVTHITHIITMFSRASYTHRALFSFSEVLLRGERNTLTLQEIVWRGERPHTKGNSLRLICGFSSIDNRDRGKLEQSCARSDPRFAVRSLGKGPLLIDIRYAPKKPSRARSVSHLTV